MEVVSWRLCHGVCFVSCVISSILRLCHLIIILIILLLCYYYLIIILLSFYYYLSIILLHTFKLEKSITQPLEFLSAYLWSDPVGTRRRRAKALRRRAPPQDSNLTLFEHACLELELRTHLKHHSSSGRTSSGAGGTRHEGNQCHSHACSSSGHEGPFRAPALRTVCYPTLSMRDRLSGVAAMHTASSDRETSTDAPGHVEPQDTVPQ